MLGNLNALRAKKGIRPNENKTKTNCFRHYEFLDGSFFRRSFNRSAKEVDVLTINDEEARQLSGEYSLVKAAKKIQRNGAKIFSNKKRRTRSTFI